MALTQVTPQKMAETLIGQQIVGFEIDYENETITLQLTNNDLEFEGDGLSIRCYDLQEGSRLN